MSGYLARNPLMTDEPQFGPPPVVAGPPVLPNPLAMPAGDWRDTIAPQPTQADAADATKQAYTEWQARDRQRQIDLGYVDPKTGALTPEGWRAQAQTIAGGFGPADVGMATGLLGSIKAYHGSPHSFERFDMSKIGTGEGAQAYGHGLYFAENEGVARGYRDQLTHPVDHPDLIAARDAYNAAYNLPMGGTEAEFNAALAKRDQAFAALQAAKELPKVQRQGSMYEVNLNAEPDQMLHWDKPLSEQPEIMEKLISAGLPRNIFRSRSGADAYDTLRDIIASKYSGSPPPGFNARAEAAHALRDAGIPGISYLDAGSRGGGQGSRNHIMFDDATIDILRKYGIAGLIGGGAAATAAGGNQGQNQ